MNQKAKRKGYGWVTFWRYVDVIAMTAISVFVLHIIYPFIVDKAYDFRDGILLKPIPAVSYQLFASLVAFAGFWYLNKSGGLVFKKSGLRYPPLWVVACLGFASFIVISLSLYGNFGWRQCFALWPLTLPLVVKLVCWALGLLPTGTKWRNEDSAEKPASDNDFDKIMVWAISKGPCNSRADDLFDHVLIAQNLVDTITDTAEHCCVALTASLGMGKSTILTWAQQDLKEYGYTVSRIDSWGRDGETLVKQILSKGINDLRDKVDILPFLNVPSEYVNALSGGSVVKRLKAYLKAAPDSLSALQRLDNMLGACSTPLVFFIEDIDRNTGEEFLSSTFPAFLDRASTLNNISFVLAIDAEFLKGDILGRVCNYALSVSPVSRKLVTDLVLNLRQGAYEPGIIDPQSDRDELFEITPQREGGFGDLSYYFGNKPSEKVCGALVSILSTPRMIKFVVRDAQRIWSKLAGEIDFDQLLVLCAIKHVHPEHYKFLLNHLTEFRSYATSSSEYNKEAKDELWDQLKNIDGYTPALYRLFTYLLPSVEHTSPYLQGVISDSFTDYWARIEAERLRKGEISDQRVLSDLQKYQDDTLETAELLDRLMSQDPYAKKVEQFGRMVDGVRLQYLASCLFAKIKELYADEAPQRLDSIVGYKDLWGCYLDSPVGEEQHNHWLIDEVIKYSPNDLGYACSLFYWWAHNTRYEVSIKQRNARAFSSFVDFLKTSWATDSGSIVRSLTSERHNLLYQLCISVGSRHISPKKMEPRFITDHYSNADFWFTPLDWLWLCPLLLEVLEGNTQLIIEELVNMLVHTSGEAGFISGDIPDEVIEQNLKEYARQYTFFGAMAEAWLGESLPKFLDKFKLIDLSSYKGIRRVLMYKAKTFAEEYNSTPLQIEVTSDAMQPPTEG